MYEKETEELLSQLKEDKDISHFLAENEQEMVKPLHEYLTALLAEKQLNKSEVVRTSLLDRAYAYHIFSGSKKNPSRPKLLALALAMGLNLSETQYLLRYAGLGLLYPRHPWDSVIISALERGLSVKDTNSLLDSLGENNLLE